jgi:hypothetical protein
MYLPRPAARHRDRDSYRLQTCRQSMPSLIISLSAGARDNCREVSIWEFGHRVRLKSSAAAAAIVAGREAFQQQQHPRPDGQKGGKGTAAGGGTGHLSSAIDRTLTGPPLCSFVTALSHFPRYGSIRHFATWLWLCIVVRQRDSRDLGVWRDRAVYEIVGIPIKEAPTQTSCELISNVLKQTHTFAEPLAQAGNP